MTDNQLYACIWLAVTVMVGSIVGGITYSNTGGYPRGNLTNHVVITMPDGAIWYFPYHMPSVDEKVANADQRIVEARNTDFAKFCDLASEHMASWVKYKTLTHLSDATIVQIEKVKHGVPDGGK